MINMRVIYQICIHVSSFTRSTSLSRNQSDLLVDDVGTLAAFREGAEGRGGKREEGRGKKGRERHFHPRYHGQYARERARERERARAGCFVRELYVIDHRTDLCSNDRLSTK
jgi:hypothetical protein